MGINYQYVAGGWCRKTFTIVFGNSSTNSWDYSWTCNEVHSFIYVSHKRGTSALFRWQIWNWNRGNSNTEATQHRRMPVPTAMKSVLLFSHKDWTYKIEALAAPYSNDLLVAQPIKNIEVDKRGTIYFSARLFYTFNIISIIYKTGNTVSLLGWC